MKYFFAFLATVGLIIIVILLLLSGGHTTPKKKSATPVKKNLYEYANTTAEMRLVVDGPVNAQDLHESYQIRVNRDQAEFIHIDGYNGAVYTTRTYGSNLTAYTNFLYALQHAGFTLGSKEKINPLGYCATGQRYSFQIVQDGQMIQDYWSSSCGKPATFLGNVSLTMDLFQSQIPNINELLGDFSEL